MSGRGAWLAVGLACAASRGSAEEFAGGSGAWELDLPRGAVEAVGGAAAAPLADGADAVGLNPARLAGLAGAGLGAGYTRLPLGLADGSVAGAVHLGAAGVLGGALRMLRADVPGAIEDPTGAFGGPGGDIPVRTFVGTVAWAPDLAMFDGDLPAKLRLGASVDVLRRELGGPAATGAGGNLGLTAEWPEGFAGFARLRHLGWTDGIQWPVAADLGGAWSRRDLLAGGDLLRAAVAATWSRESGAGGSALVEFGLHGERFGAAVRAGWRIAAVESPSLLPAAGVMLRASHLTLDAGWAPLGPFGWTTSLNLGWTIVGEDPGI